MPRRAPTTVRSSCASRCAASTRRRGSPAPGRTRCTRRGTAAGRPDAAGGTTRRPGRRPSAAPRRPGGRATAPATAHTEVMSRLRSALSRSCRRAAWLALSSKARASRMRNPRTHHVWVCVPMRETADDRPDGRGDVDDQQMGGQQARQREDRQARKGAGSGRAGTRHARAATHPAHTDTPSHQDRRLVTSIVTVRRHGTRDHRPLRRNPAQPARLPKLAANFTLTIRL